MASAKLDLIRSIYAAWERGDYSRVVEWADPEIEFAFADGSGRWEGRAVLAEGWRQWLDAWDDYRVEPEEYLEVDGERVLVLMRHHGRGKTSGLEVGRFGAKGANLFRLPASVRGFTPDGI